ncbi:MAG TPA: hypothetical protein VMX74_03810 [Pirellulales bacterium]|nr:hypothetical protein [Pirellulales bacterium]
MTNMLQDGVAWLGGQLKNSAGLTVTYYRGAGSVSITATATMHEFELVDSDGIITIAVARDYIVHAADLVISAVTITPRGGDRIVETINGLSQTFEVVPFGNQDEHEPVDPDSLLLTIHTKRIS